MSWYSSTRIQRNPANSRSHRSSASSGGRPSPRSSSTARRITSRNTSSSGCSARPVKLVPAAAYYAVRFVVSQIETSRLKRLLLDVATVDDESEDHYALDTYQISEALNSLDGRNGVSPDEMAQLEFLYIEALDRSEHGIRNLERQIVESPTIFFQALALAFKRRDQGQDPPEWRIDDPKRRDGMAFSAHSLLDQIKPHPGYRDRWQGRYRSVVCLGDRSAPALR